MLEQLSFIVFPVNARPKLPRFPSLQRRKFRGVPDMYADGVETCHFCHRARSCSLKAGCAHPRSTHRRRGIHHVHTVDNPGTQQEAHYITRGARMAQNRTLLCSYSTPAMFADN